MYLTINGTRHTVKRRLVSADTIKYLGVTPEPGTIAGKVQMYRDDGFLMSEDKASNYSRQLYSGTLLQLTNKPELSTAPFVPATNPTAPPVVTAAVG